MSILKFFILSILAISCVTTSKNKSHDPYHGTAIKWHRGSIESAFKLAQKTSKPVFLYWGALWCPPCNELKANVFSQPRAAELTKSVIPVYLDGDSEYAQAWGELFQISGYPTILLLSGEKKELMRLAEYVSIEEFEQAFKIGLNAKTPFKETLDRAVGGSASENDWKILANFSWYGARDMDVNSENILLKRIKLIDGVPASMPIEKAQLTASLLEAASALKAKSSVTRKVKARADSYIETIMTNEKTLYASRSLLLYNLKGLTEFLFPKPSKKRTLFIENWLKAVDQLRMNKNISREAELWTWYAHIQAHNLLNPKKSLSVSLTENVKLAVQKANLTAVTPFQRQSVITGAAYLLRKVKLYDDAAKLLLDEVKITKFPYYFYSSLASLEKERDQGKKSLEYSEKARLSAKGGATKLQWIVSDISMSVKLAKKEKQKRLQELANEFYRELFHLKDGFSGRSYRSTKRLSSIVKEQPLTAEMTKMLKGYSTRCQRLKKASQLRCNDHFKVVLKI